jgi:hypothetical protein
VSKLQTNAKTIEKCLLNGNTYGKRINPFIDQDLDFEKKVPSRNLKSAMSVRRGATSPLMTQRPREGETREGIVREFLSDMQMNKIIPLKAMGRFNKTQFKK